MIFLHRVKLPKKTMDALVEAGYVPVLVDDFDSVQLVSGRFEGSIEMATESALKTILGTSSSSVKSNFADHLCRLYLNNAKDEA